MWGHARAVCALLREDRAAARDALGRAVAAADRAASTHGIFWAWWGLVSLLDDAGSASRVLTRLGAPDVRALPVNQALAGYPRAAAAGLRGDAGEAARLVAGAGQALAGQPAFGLCRIAPMPGPGGRPQPGVMSHSTASCPVHFDGAGRGEPALAYLAGWCSTRASYAAVLERTAGHRRSIAIDWRGHGTSPAASGDFGWPELADDVLAVLAGWLPLNR